MIKPDLSVDLSEAEELLKALSPRNVSKPIRHALNNTALAARDAVRKDMPNRFTIRRPWAVRGIGAEFAKSGNLEAAVFSRDAFMRDQEEGGVRSGARARSIPVGRMRALHSSRVIPKALRPQAIMNKKNVFYHAGMLFERRSKGRVEALYMFRKQTRIPARFGMEHIVGTETLRVFRQKLEREIFTTLGA